MRQLCRLVRKRDFMVSKLTAWENATRAISICPAAFGLRAGIGGQILRIFAKRAVQKPKNGFEARTGIAPSHVLAVANSFAVQRIGGRGR